MSGLLSIYTTWGKSHKNSTTFIFVSENTPYNHKAIMLHKSHFENNKANISSNTNKIIYVTFNNNEPYAIRLSGGLHTGILAAISPRNCGQMDSTEYSLILIPVLSIDGNVILSELKIKIKSIRESTLWGFRRIFLKLSM